MKKIKKIMEYKGGGGYNSKLFAFSDENIALIAIGAIATNKIYSVYII